MKATIRSILGDVGRLDVSLASLADNDDLYGAGLSSLATVHVMLALENAFDIEIPDHMLTRQLFRSIDSLADAVATIQRQEAA